ncbi:MAG: SDR family NAD(P)-dependent oxidoreductase [Vicingaceae bacterium]
MNYYIITGSSKGLGKSLLDLLLTDESNFVYGLSRTSSIEHKQYIDTNIDLSKMEEVLKFQFPQILRADKVVLINNAANLGDVKHVGGIDNQKIIEAYNLNLITPVILANNFISEYSELECEKIILNISSGAGRKPIDGWNVYCSTKAGLDMFSRVLKDEITIDSSNIKVLSLAPGIIDTEMQSEVRRSNEMSFSNIERFKYYKESGYLVAPEITAKQVLRFIDEDNLSKDVICSVRDLTE